MYNMMRALFRVYKSLGDGFEDKYGWAMPFWLFWSKGVLYKRQGSVSLEFNRYIGKWSSDGTCQRKLAFFAFWVYVDADGSVSFNLNGYHFLYDYYRDVVKDEFSEDFYADTDVVTGMNGAILRAVGRKVYETFTKEK